MSDKAIEMCISISKAVCDDCQNKKLLPMEALAEAFKKGAKFNEFSHVEGNELFTIKATFDDDSDMFFGDGGYTAAIKKVNP